MTTKPTSKQKQQMFLKWLREQPKQSKTIKTANLKRSIKDELERYKTEDGIKEYTLHHKWLEVKKIANEYEENELDEVYSRIWVPKGLSDYRRLQPELIEIRDLYYEQIGFFGERYSLPITEQDNLSDHWNILRALVSSQTHDGTFGKSIRFLVRDKISQKYLGVIALSNDMLAIKKRDEAIGISNQQWAAGGLNKHSINASTLIPTQPFGRRYFGGKLLALLALSKPVMDAWERKYGDKLVSVTTTSLWRNIKEGVSQYDGMEAYWKNLGDTSGSSPLKPSEPLYQMLRQWMRENFDYDYWFHFVAKDEKGLILQRDNKNRAISFCMKQLGFEKSFYTSHHRRGIYFARLYQNTDEFYRGEIGLEGLISKFDNSVESLVDVWRYGTAGDRTYKSSKDFHKGMTKGRIDKQLKTGKFVKYEKPDWYLEDAKLNFEQMKIKRIMDVGR
jgi:hypothetical protein